MVKNVYKLSDPHGYHTGIKEVDPNYSFFLPRYYTLGFSLKKGSYAWSLDSETIYGEYGGTGHKKAEFWFIRTGLEKKVKRWLIVRGGLIFPVIARTSSMGDIRKDLPFPKISGAIGAGVNMKRFSLDLAVFGDTGRSYVEQKPKLAFTGSLLFKFP